MADKKLNLTELIYGGTALDDGVAAIFYPPRVVVADTSTIATDRIIEVGVLGSPSRTIEVSSATIATAGFRVLIKDVTGFASKDQFINISTEGSQTIDGQAFVVITRPYGSVELISDGSNLHTLPTMNGKFFSSPVHFERDVEQNGASANIDVVTLPSNPALADNIDIRFDNLINAGYPFIRCSGGGTATITSMVMEASSPSIPGVTTRPLTGTLAVPAATNVYFSSDGTAANAFTFEEIGAKGQLMFTVEGFGTCAMPPQLIKMDILSQGNTGNPSFYTIATMTGTFRSAQRFEND